MDTSSNTIFTILQAEIGKLALLISAQFSDSISATFTQLPIRLFLTTGFIILLLIATLLIAWAVVKLLLSRKQLDQPYILFEVKPLKETLQSSYTTQQLFSLIHGLAQQRSWIFRLFNVNKTYAFEIVATKRQGIRYLIRVPVEDSDLIQKSLLSYLPGLSISEVSDYVTLLRSPKITELKQTNHFAFPLKKLQELEQYDPMAYITGNMTKLASEETLAFQVLVSPLNKKTIKDITEITKLLYTNRDLLSSIRNLGSYGFVLSLLATVIKITLQILLLPLGLLVFLLSDGREGPLLGFPFEASQEKTLNPYQNELEILIKEKLDQPLFIASLRLMVDTKSAAENAKKRRGFLSAFSAFNNAGYQSLTSIRYPSLKLLEKLTLFAFKKRVLGLLQSPTLSISEISDLYHFPFTDTTQTEDLVKTFSKELPAPLALKNGKTLDVVFAKNTYGGSTTPIGLQQEERRRHVYILGATGTGKSTMLLSMLNQDIQNGKGVCLIDPHGDLAESLLTLIPKERVKDVIYFNPDDIRYPIALNLLELPTLEDTDSLREQEFITESIISLFNKLYPDHTARPRMEYILRNAIYTAFTTPNPTIFTILNLLVDAPFRRSVVKELQKLPDKNLYNFWKYEFNKAGDYQKVSMIMPITNKIGRFQFSTTARRILEQKTSKIEFSDIMDSKKILICNVSKGRLGEDISEMFGILLMTKIQLAALRRSRQKQADRKDFYLYVDEFQNFATPAFAQILSEARKYRLNAVLAHQTVSQIEDTSLVNVTLANTGTVICFRTANPIDEQMILPQFAPYVNPGEITNLASYHFYIKLAALEPQTPFSGETMPVVVPDDEAKMQEIIESSRSLYATYYQPEVPESPPKKPKKKGKTKSSRAVKPLH